MSKLTSLFTNKHLFLVRRRPMDAPVRRCETIECLEYRRSRRRPKKSWSKVIRHDLRTLVLVEDMAQDRKL